MNTSLDKPERVYVVKTLEQKLNLITWINKKACNSDFIIIFFVLFFNFYYFNSVLLIFY